ncbi:MAG: CopG family transcriptional regulator [Calditrichia bacterium]
MKMLITKLSRILETRLKALSKKRRVNKSEIVRRALIAYFSRDDASNSGSFLDLSKDLAGSVEGPADLSTNKTHMEGYGK